MPVAFTAEYVLAPDPLANEATRPPSRALSERLSVCDQGDSFQRFPEEALSLTLSEMIKVRVFDHSHVNVQGATKSPGCHSVWMQRSISKAASVCIRNCHSGSIFEQERRLIHQYLV
jgi:hypothetical protein